MLSLLLIKINYYIIIFKEPLAIICDSVIANVPPGPSMNFPRPENQHNSIWKAPNIKISHQMLESHYTICLVFLAAKEYASCKKSFTVMFHRDISKNFIPSNTGFGARS